MSPEYSKVGITIQDGGIMQQYCYDLRDALYNETVLGGLPNAAEHIDGVLLVIKNLLFRVETSKFTDFRLRNIVSDEDGFTFFWESDTEESICPRCGVKSRKKRHTYKTRTLADAPIINIAVTHKVKLNVYMCDDCCIAGDSKSFVEPISAICRGSHIKTTITLDEKIVNDAIYRSANSLAENYKGSIDVSAGTIINRLKEAGGIVTKQNLTKTSGVKVLAVDDNNGRKGSSATASTVVVDTERHIIIVVAKGADSETAKKVFDRFPDAEKLSRDRACAYAKAGEECGLIQMADIFHLVANAHDAVKEAITRGLNYNVYIKGGDGWSNVSSEVTPKPVDTEGMVEVTTINEDDIVLRVQLASLSVQQEKRYRRVIELMKLHDQGYNSKEIDNRLDLTKGARIELFRNAADVINGVEERIDDYYAHIGRGKFRQEFMPKNGRPSSESIVEPYSDTVMKMVEEGHNHRTIYPVIKEMGFTGCSNAIYQYILKKRVEAGTHISSPQESLVLPDGTPARPPRITLQRVTRTAVYRFVLHEAFERRNSAVVVEEPEQKDSVESIQGTAQEKSIKEGAVLPGRTRRTFCSEMVADIIHGKEKTEAQPKKRTRPDYASVADKNPVVWQSVDFLSDMHRFIDMACPNEMDTFIEKYIMCGTGPFEKYARGIKEDYISVKNAILNRDINNGQAEGFNNKIKLLRRVRYGRSKEELLNAFCVLSTLPSFQYSYYLVLRIERVGVRGVRYYDNAA